jgi:hypothetical protein
MAMRILKEGFKKIAHPIQQGVGILLLERHVVLHHRGQIVPIDGAVVGVAHRVLGQPLGNLRLGIVGRRTGHGRCQQPLSFFAQPGGNYRAYVNFVIVAYFIDVSNIERQLLWHSLRILPHH